MLVISVSQTDWFLDIQLQCCLTSFYLEHLMSKTEEYGRIFELQMSNRYQNIGMLGDT